MKPRLFLILIFLNVLYVCYSQKESIDFDFNFETINSANNLSENWIRWGKDLIEIDKKDKQDGNQSIKITGGQNFGCLALKIKGVYVGETIELTGFIKTKNVSNGHAGLLLRMDGVDGVIDGDNMSDQNLEGTNEWEKYKVTLPYSKASRIIYIGGILTGQGEAWFDNFTITIDGKDISTLNRLNVSDYLEKAKLSLTEDDKKYGQFSNFELLDYTDIEISNLKLLCKVWGFAKYHHPEIAKGKLNWDHELFKILPSIKKENFQSKLANWVNNIGPLKTNSPATLQQGEIKLPAQNEWIDQSKLIGEDLRVALKKIEKGPKHKRNHYIDFHPSVGNPKFQNENAYPNMDFKDTGYRLLGLFRYWNMIEYFFPYRHLMDENWDDVLSENLKRMLNSNDELSYEITLLNTISKIQDTHAQISGPNKSLSKYFGELSAPVEVKYIESKIVVTRLLPKDGFNTNLQVGDEVIAIDNKAIATTTKEMAALSPASNHAVQMRDVCRKILRTNQSSIEIKFKDKNGQINTDELKTFPRGSLNFYDNKEATYKFIEGKNIGYFNPGKLKKGEIHKIYKLFKNTDGIIIDFRSYPSDFIVYSFSNYLMPKSIPFVKFTQGQLKHPGQFNFRDGLTIGKNNPDYYKGKLIILINETTQSSAEFHTMAFRNAPKATVIGSTTAAADGNVSLISLPGGIKTRITGIGVYYPDGSETQRIGIIPDIEIHPTIDGIRNGKDELLEKAIEVIEEE